MSKLSYYPDMSSEVLEAVHLMYEDYPEVEVDCLLYLTELQYNRKLSNDLSMEAVEKLKEMGRCPNCGEPLQTYHYQEPHPELDGCPKEDFYELYCSRCDIRGDDI